MKFSPATAALVFLLPLGSLIPSSTATGTGGTVAGAVEDVTGRAIARSAPQDRPLAARDPVFLADTVMTGPASRLDLRLGRDLSLQLGENGTLTVADFSAEIGVDLEAGAILVDKDPASAGRPLTIDSRFGQVSVRGTQVFVGPSRGPFAVFVSRGRVTVSGGGTTVTLNAGDGTTITAPGTAPSPPVQWGQARIDEALAQFRR